MQQILSLGTVATAVGLVLTVWAWKMNASTANGMLVVAWALFVLSTYFSVPYVVNQPAIPRALLTTLVASIIGLVLYTRLWTATTATAPTHPAVVDIQAPERMPTAAEIADEVAKKSPVRTPPTVETVRGIKPPPIAVTKFVVGPSFEIGKPLEVFIEMESAVSGLEVRGWNLTIVGVADETALSEAHRPANENRIWRLYEQKARDAVPMVLTTTKGTMHAPLNGPVLTQQDVQAMGDINGIVYAAGQIDYGSGTLDYCVYSRVAAGGWGSLCVEHNGPSPTGAVFKR